jgi:YVTN family beta-propeller protein
MMKAVIFAAALALAAPASAASTYSVIASIPGPDGGWDLLSVDPVHHRAYIARSEAVMAVDLTSNIVTGALLPAQRGHAALAIPGTDEAIVTNGNSDNAQIFDGRSGKVRATIAVGKKPDAAAYDPLTRHLFVLNADSGDISVIDPKSASVVATIAVGGSLELGVADGRGLLFVNVEDKNDVAVIDTRTNKLVRRFALAGCDGPTGIAYAPEAKRLVSACANGRAIVSEPSGKLLASLAIGEGPDGAEYDARRHVALVPSGRTGTLAVIDVRGTPRVVQTLATVKGARTIAIDASTGRAYLPSAQYLPAVGKDRPKMVPGTFRLLVVGPAEKR